MLKAIYTAALGMMPQQTKLESAANNIANAQTTGFKREGVFQQSLIEARDNLHNVAGDIEQDDPRSSRYADFAQGSFEKTDNPFDLAIDGKGYFMLLDENGDESFTRAGRFALAADGSIVAPDGKALLGDGGPLVIPEFLTRRTSPQDEQPLELRVRETGEVFVNQEFLGRVQIVDIQNPQTMQRLSGTQFAPTEETFFNAIPAEDLHLKQGFLELSNVDIVQEMVEMIHLQRGFELGHRVINTNDGTLERSIEIGRVL